MKKQLAHLMIRRAALVGQAAAQRSRLGQCVQPWRPRLAIADRGIAALRYIQRYPALLVVGSLALAALRPQRAGRWLTRGWMLWRLGRRVLWR